MTTAAIRDKRTTSLEELVGRLIDALRWNDVPTQASSTARHIHDARRLRQSGDLDGALAVMAVGHDTAVTEAGTRWLHSEWMDLVRRRFRDRQVLVYSPGEGRAAALAPAEDGLLQVVAVLGMSWQPGKTLSHRSLRGLRPLQGGGPWS